MSSVVVKTLTGGVSPLPGSGPNSSVGQVTSQHATAARSPRRAEPPAGSPDPDPELRTHLQRQKAFGQDDASRLKYITNHRRRRVMTATYSDVSSLAREVDSGLERTLEARHRPLAVSRASCRGFVQRQVSDTTHEPSRARSLKFRTTQHRQRIISFIIIIIIITTHEEEKRCVINSISHSDTDL